VENIVFDAAVFTNLSLDHLDFHHTMDRYFAAKVRLFNQLAHDGTAFINIDDAFGHKLYDSLDRKKRSCSIGNSEADYSYTTLHLSEKGMQGSIKTPGGMITTEAPLLGRFNAMNLLQAIAVWKEYHPDIILNHFDLTDLNPLPGRMEMIRTKSHGTVIIDYAHTPDAIKNILKSIHDIPHHATTVVFGCGGDRDKSKRPDMGRIVESYADRIILTNDNPRSENPDHIIRDIRKGLSEKSGLEIMTDRFAAIHQALSESTPEDVILLLGKGAEEYMEIQGRKIPCNDKEIVLSWIKKNEN
jgi:UDP-N-acetylmuramoyl-L-alanyl-D-glutamate--2,6-diaminopimelate ligase